MGTPATWVAGNVLTAAQLNAELRDKLKAVQNVQQTVKTSTFTDTSTTSTRTDITGMSASITPISTSNKVLVTVNMFYDYSAGGILSFFLMRGSTDIFIGDAAGSRQRGLGADVQRITPTFAGVRLSAVYLDSPATTSATTYKIQFYQTIGGLYVNRTADDTDAAYSNRTASSITLQEIPQ